MKELTLAAVVENTDTVITFVDECLEQFNCSLKAQTQINIAIDELFGNIASYAYSPLEGQATVCVDFDEAGNTVSVTFIDSGIPYNPLVKQDPNVKLSADERDIGGLGIYIVKKSMDNIFYEYRNGQNILTICKKII